MELFCVLKSESYRPKEEEIVTHLTTVETRTLKEAVIEPKSFKAPATNPPLLRDFVLNLHSNEGNSEPFNI